MIFLSHSHVEHIIDCLPESTNKNFLKSSHNLWIRFKNYTKSPPMALKVDNQIVSLIFSTFNKNGYTNNYEVVTLAGHEGKGYAHTLWDEYVDYAYNVKGMRRLKNSCVPSSVPWHIKNGLVFWAVDSTGSLRTDQPLFPSIKEQVEARKQFIKYPMYAMPREPVCDKLFREQITSHKFGPKKYKQVVEAIKTAGENWLGDKLKPDV